MEVIFEISVGTLKHVIQQKYLMQLNFFFADLCNMQIHHRVFIAMNNLCLDRYPSDRYPSL